MKIYGLENDINIEFSDLTEDDMPNEQFKEVFCFCGPEVAIKLLSEFAGCTIQVPLNGFKKIIQFSILQEYDGTTIGVQRLARKYGTTEKNVREILFSKSNAPVEGQKRLFNTEDFKRKAN